MSIPGGADVIALARTYSQLFRLLVRLRSSTSAAKMATLSTVRRVSEAILNY